MSKVVLAFLTLVGFSLAERVVVINVEGMTCDMCPIAVKKGISKVKGVKWVLTSLKNQIAIAVVEDDVKDESLLEAISGAGNYRGNIIGESKF